MSDPLPESEVDRVRAELATQNVSGGSSATLVRMLYDALRRRADHELGRRGAVSIQATSLVHDVYLRISPQRENWDGKGHFYAAAARAMRELLIERARRKRAAKHGGGLRREPEAVVAELTADGPAEEVLEVDAALKKLESQDERKGQLIELRYFCGLSNAQTADVLGVSVGTVERDWRLARQMLRRWMSEAG